MNKDHKYRGIIFDLDGTLVDTVEDLTDALNTVMERHHFNRVSVDQMRRMIGNGLRMVIIRAVPESFKKDDVFVDAALEEMKEAYKKIWVNKSKAYPGIPELLTWARERGIALGVSSNKVDDAVNYIIETIFPDIAFSSVVGNREGIPHKPDPTQTKMVIEQMKLEPDEILYVGDSEVDYETALNSGLTPLILTYGYGDYEKIKKLPVITRERPDEIIEFLDS